MNTYQDVYSALDEIEMAALQQVPMTLDVESVSHLRNLMLDLLRAAHKPYGNRSGPSNRDRGDGSKPSVRAPAPLILPVSYRQHGPARVYYCHQGGYHWVTTCGVHDA